MDNLSQVLHSAKETVRAVVKVLEETLIITQGVEPVHIMNIHVEKAIHVYNHPAPTFKNISLPTLTNG